MSVNPLAQFRKECAQISGKHAKLLEVPAKGQADLALPCFRFSENPVEKAKKLAEKLNTKITERSEASRKKSLIERIEAAGSYVNFYINNEVFSAHVLNSILKEKENFGAGKKKKEKILLEHTSINPSGPVHVGRLRNSLIGDSLSRILKFAGWPVLTYYYVNDVGKQIAIIAWGKRNHIEPNEDLMREYKNYASKPDFDTMFIYVAALATISEMQEVEKILQKCEAGDLNELSFLRKISENCLEGQKNALSRLDILFDNFVFESDFIKSGDVKKILTSLKKKKILHYYEGALAIDLSKYGLREHVILARKDGTSVYLLRDLAFHLMKAKKANRIINVVGEDHKLEMQELKAILQNNLGFKTPMDIVHFSFVNFRGLKLSTRRGQIAALDELIDEGTEKALEEIKKRSHISAEQETAEKIASAAIKYHIIKIDPMKAITFDWSSALTFEGDTGPYLQYTHARANSVLERANFKITEMNENEGNKITKTKTFDFSLYDPKEIKLIRKLAQFPDFVEKCASNLKPHYLANYLAELAAAFNEFYQSIRIIGSEKEEERIALVFATKNVLASGLKLLGIEPLEKM